MRSCGIIIPAFNEAASVGTVVSIALEAKLGPVLVVDDGSQDATAQVAKQAGAEVLKLEHNLGKGGAVVAGAQQLKTDVIVLLDADLTGLSAEHVQQLAEPVVNNQADMTRGVFVGGRWRTATAQRLMPQLNGQRALVREKLLEINTLADSRYGIEIAITEYAKRQHWHCQDIPLLGVSQIMKEEKRGFWKGFLIRLRMYAEITRTWLRNM